MRHLTTIPPYSFINDFINQLAEAKDLDNDQRSLIANSIQQLENIRNYQFSVLVLSAELDVDTVAEIFQRINAGGIPLNSADFILTLMSVYWVEGRHQLEDFSRRAKYPLQIIVHRLTMPSMLPLLIKYCGWR